MIIGKLSALMAYDPSKQTFERRHRDMVCANKCPSHFAWNP